MVVSQRLAALQGVIASFGSMACVRRVMLSHTSLGSTPLGGSCARVSAILVLRAGILPLLHQPAGAFPLIANRHNLLGSGDRDGAPVPCSAWPDDGPRFSSMLRDGTFYDVLVD